MHYLAIAALAFILAAVLPLDASTLLKKKHTVRKGNPIPASALKLMQSNTTATPNQQTKQAQALPVPSKPFHELIPDPYPIVWKEPPDSPTCEFMCSGHGVCRSKNNCSCVEGWWGLNCSNPIPCPPCVNGICHKGVCVCARNYMGWTCDQWAPPSQAGLIYPHPNATMKSGSLNATATIAGNSTQVEGQVEARGCHLQEDCNSNGVCAGGVCVCLSGWKGDHCEIVVIDSHEKTDQKYGVPMWIHKEGEEYEPTPQQAEAMVVAQGRLGEALARQEAKEKGIADEEMSKGNEASKLEAMREATLKAENAAREAEPDAVEPTPEPLPRRGHRTHQQLRRAIKQQHRMQLLQMQQKKQSQSQSQSLGLWAD